MKSMKVQECRRQTKSSRFVSKHRNKARLLGRGISMNHRPLQVEAQNISVFERALVGLVDIRRISNSDHRPRLYLSFIKREASKVVKVKFTRQRDLVARIEDRY